MRNLIRQGKVEQIYSVMQTGTARGMQTMEQALADLLLRGVITRAAAFSRASKPEGLDALVQRGVTLNTPLQMNGAGLQLAEV